MTDPGSRRLALAAVLALLPACDRTHAPPVALAVDVAATPTVAGPPDVPTPTADVPATVLLPGRWSEVAFTAPATLAEGRHGTGRALVYEPAGRREGRRLPLVIALHGWGGAAGSWTRRSHLDRLADRYQMVLAFPDMGRTVYEARWYPETRGRWNGVPGARWVGEVVLPALRERVPVRQDVRGTAIMGYSTGGRGAVVVALRYPQFGFCASLSGTYDLSRLRPEEGEYGIHAAVFGSRERFPDRWRDEDVRDGSRAGALATTEFYLAHGAADRVVSADQVGPMRDFLARHHARAEVVVTPGAGHDWDFWNARFPDAFARFAAALAGP